MEMAFKLMITKKSDKYTDKIQITDDKPMAAKELKELIMAILEIENKEAAEKEITMDPKEFDKMLRELQVQPLSDHPVPTIKDFKNEYKGDTNSTVEYREYPVKEKSKNTEPVKSRPRAVDLIGSERSSFSIADKFLKNKDSETKFDRPAPPAEEMVKVAVECRLCGHESGQKGYKFNTFIKCYGCNTKLYLQPAGVKSGELDEHGNYFVAKNKLLSAKERWEHQNSQKG